MKLTPKQQRFCDYYIETGNATEAYKRAGYSHKNDNVAGVEGKKLLRNPKIERYVREHMEAIRSPVIASQEEVLERLTSVLRGEGRVLKRPRISKSKNKEGKWIEYESYDEITVYPQDQDIIRAGELLGKRYMMWTEKKEVSITVPTFVDDVPVDEDE
ncbi:terminase small subunit [Bacillus cereus]